MPTITVIVNLAHSFNGTQSQSRAVFEGLGPVFICVRFKGQGDRKWLSGLLMGRGTVAAGQYDCMAHGSVLTMPNETHPAPGDYWGRCVPKCLCERLCVHKEKSVCLRVYTHICTDCCKLPSE